MSSEFGNIIRVSVFGQSHGKAIGVVVDGLPAGEAIDLEELQRFLDRRRPGTGPLSTARKETDVPEFLSGLEGGKTCGAPLCAVIKNADQHSKDYGELAGKPRPGHADFTAWAKWGGHADMRGGGHFSGRLTAPLCVAGGIAKQILARRGIFVGAHLASVAGICDRPFPLHPTAPPGPSPSWTRRRGSGCAPPFWRRRTIWTAWGASSSAPPPACPPGWESPCSGALKTAWPRPFSAFPP